MKFVNQALMRFFKSLISVSLLFLGVVSVSAQNISVRGVVSDQMGPLPGVGVQVKGTSSGTVTEHIP